jgi:hypothetical protein
MHPVPRSRYNRSMSNEPNQLEVFFRQAGRNTVDQGWHITIAVIAVLLPIAAALWCSPLAPGSSAESLRSVITAGGSVALAAGLWQLYHRLRTRTR